ncbi:MAG: hypothetical protein ABIQ18_01895 [Umezawaea sp.]
MKRGNGSVTSRARREVLSGRVPGSNGHESSLGAGGETAGNLLGYRGTVVGWPRRLFAVHAVVLEVLHPKQPGGRDELLEGFGSLATTFLGRLYGMRSAQARERLLAETGRRSGDGAV